MAYLALVILFPFKAEQKKAAFLFFFPLFKCEPCAGGEAHPLDGAAPRQCGLQPGTGLSQLPLSKSILQYWLCQTAEILRVKKKKIKKKGGLSRQISGKL